MSLAGPFDALVDVSLRLEQLGVRFALVGGLAVSIRAEVRFTRDVDLAIAASSDAEVESLTRALLAEGFTAVAVVMQTERDRIAIARVRSRDGIVVDLLAASSGIEAEIVANATLVPGLERVPVAAAEHLLAMKVLSSRPQRLQDEIDVRSLLATQSIDLESVRAALSLIEARGYARGQDLQQKLERILVAARG